MPKIKFKLFIYPAFFACIFFALAGNSQAATYYVDATNGNDSWTGTAGAFTSGLTGPWKTVGKVNGYNFQAGDDVYFKCGETWNLRQEWTRLLIDHSGANENNYAVFGAYYLGAGGNPVYGVSGAKPVFITYDAAIRSDQYWGIVETHNQSYIQVENLDLRDTLGNGIWLQDGNYFRVYNCVSTNTGGSGMTVTGASYVHYSGNNVSRYRESIETSSGAGLGVTESDHVLIEQNTVHKAPAGTGGEGIYAFFNCDDVEIRYNTVYDIVRIGIYIGTNITNCKIHDNLLYGTTDLAWQAYYNCTPGPCTRFPGYGIGIEDEYWLRDQVDCGQTICPSKGIDVYNNLIAYVRIGFWLNMPDDYPSTWKYDGIRIYNNSIIAPWTGIHDPGTSTGDWTNSYIKNNLFSCMGEPNCTMYSGPATQGWVADYNLWPSAVSAPLSGTHDVINADPKLTKTSGWRNLSVGSLSPNDFKLQSTSPAIDRGAALGSPYNLDYFGTARPQPAQGGWDIGAHEYTASSGDTIAPGAPGGLSVK